MEQIAESEPARVARSALGIAGVAGVAGGQRGKGLSQRSVVYTLGTVRQVLAYGVAEGVLSSNVAVGVQAPRKRRGDSRPAVVWEPAELLTFRDTSDGDPWVAGWRPTLCGLRRSEVLGLR